MGNKFSVGAARMEGKFIPIKDAAIPINDWGVIHSSQHTRQIILMFREKLNIEPNNPLGSQDFEGLPMLKKCLG